MAEFLDLIQSYPAVMLIVLAIFAALVKPGLGVGVPTEGHGPHSSEDGACHGGADVNGCDSGGFDFSGFF